ncbi:hypothetical protein RB195_018634 [Necator americanus]|uniref:Uncharacterized protein n=1 Tax=Necator americanus TaxID=51031 RepID=A0ABR1CBZ3_NECAM
MLFVQTIAQTIKFVGFTVEHAKTGCMPNASTTTCALTMEYSWCEGVTFIIFQLFDAPQQPRNQPTSLRPRPLPSARLRDYSLWRANSAILKRCYEFGGHRQQQPILKCEPNSYEQFVEAPKSAINPGVSFAATLWLSAELTEAREMHFGRSRGASRIVGGVDAYENEMPSSDWANSH